MKKSYILIAVFFSSLAFCTKNNTTEISEKSNYSDSITIDMISYLIYSSKIDSSYFDSIINTAKGQPFLRPLDSIFKPMGMNTAIVPKYTPTAFEAWAYDSLPLMQVYDTTDTDLLFKVYTFSSNYYYRLDTTAINPGRGINPIPISYAYGYGFILGYMNWGIGKIKIYYK
ncbi:MAG: hypothetical protein ABSF80_05060 [Chitinispirillaceae bacterium]|jgi:hypothetical protein